MLIVKKRLISVTKKKWVQEKGSIKVNFPNPLDKKKRVKKRKIFVVWMNIAML